MIILESSGDENIVLTLNKYPLSEHSILDIATTKCINDEVSILSS